MDYFQELIEKKEKVNWIECPECSHLAPSEEDLRNHQAIQHVFTSVFAFIKEEQNLESA